MSVVYTQMKSAFIGNLPEDVNEEYLRKLFGQFGEVGAPRFLSHFFAISTNQYYMQC
jgi:hypothetical protein